MTTESEVTLPDALAWLKSLSGDYAAKIAKHINEQMKENTLLRKEIKSAYDSLNNNIVAMQACVIETEHNGHEAGFAWIWNTLCGPSLIPDPDEEWYESAQLYYSSNISEPFGPCGICGKPSNTSAAHGVSCCEEHNEQLRTNVCRENYAKNEHQTDLTLKVDNQRVGEQSMVPVKDDDFVLVPRGILGAACSAIDKKRDAPVLLSTLRELSMSVGAMRAAQEGELLAAKAVELPN